MSDGLLAVYSDPGQVPLQRFHGWYEQEHIPLRLQFPEFENAHRFEAADGLRPGWLATYDVELAFLGTDRYAALRAQRTPHEQSIVENLATLDRRIYSVDYETGPLEGEPQYQVIVGLTSQAEDGLLDWYRTEHIPLLLRIPGWRRIRQFRLVEGAGERILTIHDIDDPAACDTGLWKEATSTRWREQVMSDVTSRSRRIFKLYKTGQRPPAGWSNPYTPIEEK